jgi:hypothetical protein
MEISEKEIKTIFIEKHLQNFADAFSFKNLRLYMAEMPIFTKDGEKYADIVLEEDEHKIWQDNKLKILEFKKGPDSFQSGVAQVLKYSDVLQKQLYRKQKVESFVVAPGFSNAEIKLASEHDVRLVSYDWVSGRIIKAN